MARSLHFRLRFVGLIGAALPFVSGAPAQAGGVTQFASPAFSAGVETAACAAGGVVQTPSAIFEQARMQKARAILGGAPSALERMRLEQAGGVTAGLGSEEAALTADACPAGIAPGQRSPRAVPTPQMRMPALTKAAYPIVTNESAGPSHSLELSNALATQPGAVEATSATSANAYDAGRKVGAEALLATAALVRWTNSAAPFFSRGDRWYESAYWSPFAPGKTERGNRLDRPASAPAFSFTVPRLRAPALLTATARASTIGAAVPHERLTAAGGEFPPAPNRIEMAPAVVRTATGARGFLATNLVAIGVTPFDRDWQRVSASRLTSAEVTRSMGAPMKDRMSLIAQVNRWVNRTVSYAEDTAVWHQSNYWADAARTLRKGMGDCEDIAVVKYQALLSLGIAREDLYITVTYDLVRKADHAVLVVRQDGHFYLLDDSTDTVIDANEANDYRPIFSYGTGTWIHTLPIEAANPTYLSLNAVANARSTGFKR